MNCLQVVLAPASLLLTASLTGASSTLMPSAFVVSDPILEIHDESLTDYLPTTASNVQDVLPQVLHRGVNLEGSQRSRPLKGMRLAGNSTGSPWRAASVSGVRLDTGQFVVEDTDLLLPATVPWAIGRSFNSRQKTSGGSHRDSDGYQGRNWFQDSQPEILLYEGATDDEDVVYLIYGADRFVEFKRFDASSDTFKAKNGAAGLVVFEEETTSGEPDTYTYYDQGGYEFVFFGFDADASPAAGQFWKVVDPADNAAFVGDSSTGSTAISGGFDSGGRIEKAYDSADRRFTYSYTALDSAERLTEVKAETKSGGTWASPTGLATVGKVNYEYYTTETYGDPGDLKLVEITIPMSDAGVDIAKQKYFRYFEGTYNSTSNPGRQHALKLIVDFEGVRRFDWQDETFDDDFLTANHATLEPYAGAYFEYDSNQRIREAFFNGACGCSGAALGTHEFSYATNGSYTDGSGYDTDWVYRAVVKRPDNSYLTQYSDEVGQGLGQVTSAGDPAETSPAPDLWATGVVRDSSGLTTTLFTPASTTGYTHSTGVISTSTTDGLVSHFTYVSSGEAKGFGETAKWSEGSSGTKYYQHKTEYVHEALTDASWDADVVFVTPSKSHTYPTQTSSDTGSVVSETVPSFHSSEIAFSNVTQKRPMVATGDNGSGVADEASAYFTKDGDQTFVKTASGSITYSEFSNGKLTKFIRDADTSHGDVTATVPSGFASTGTELHHVTSYTYDAQGRNDTVTYPDGRVAKFYYSKLADGRAATLAYAAYETSPSTKFIGPVRYSVHNHGGEKEVAALVRLSGNESSSALSAHIDESDDDPIAAIDLGTVSRLRVHIFGTTGNSAEERRTYFDVPTSGAGTEGTHYDAETYGRDAMGRGVRSVSATGTIQRRAFDGRGKLTASYVGLNDSSFSGGSSSGVDDMTQVEALEYDGGNDGGNGHLTKRTEYVEDGTTGQRVTTYEHDLFGQVVLETRPVAPHIFRRYDGMGRAVAIGRFSSTASIDIENDDPSTETTNRIGLREADYDAMGRVWKSTQYAIDAADGSNDDSIVNERWFDAEGRMIKQDGRHLTKRRFDRLGRRTHVYFLAFEDDASYSDAEDLDGDVVLQERQTVYESGGNSPLVEVTINRDHDDFGGSETTGALDSNTDGDDLEFTAADITGRLFITAFWWDDLGRVTDRVDYGDNGGADFDRDGLAVPARSDTALRTSYVYGTDGQTESVEDPNGVVNHYEFDDAGRMSERILNYSASVNSGNPSGTVDNVTRRMEYTNGQRTRAIADFPAGQTDQEVVYVYGTTRGASLGDSKISTGHLLKSVQYSDSSGGSDVVAHAYNALGEGIYSRDPAGNVVLTDFDLGGRPEHVRVTTLASGFDSAVRRISREFSESGRLETVTQYTDATVGSGSIIDQIKYTHGVLGGLEKFEQDVNSAVGASGSVDDYEMEFDWAISNRGPNVVRKTSVTYPSGNVLTYDYLNSSGLHDDDFSRVSRVKDGAVVLATYAYNGMTRTNAITYPEPEVKWEMYGSTSGSYPDRDRFGRVTSSRWTKDLTTDVDFYSADLSYNRNSGISIEDDHVHAGFDNARELDGLNRWTESKEGTWSGSAITSTTRSEEFTLDHAGNWNHAKLDLDGDGNYTGTDEYDDDRTFNGGNELTGRDTDDDGTDDLTLVYDALGNVTDDGEEYKYEWDAFGRLRKVLDRSDDSLVSEYRYNGLGQRIGEHYDADDDGDVDGTDPWYYDALDPYGRVVAVFRGSDTDPKQEVYFHAAGRDGDGQGLSNWNVICRYRDANTAWTAASDGVLEQKYFFCQDLERDVVAVVANNGWIVEQARYSLSGTPFGMPGGDTDSDGDCDATDVTQVQSWIDSSTYNVLGDVDLDGDVDLTDKTGIQNNYQGTTLGRGVLSAVGNTIGRAGIGWSGATGQQIGRGAAMSTVLGRRLSRGLVGGGVSPGDRYGLRYWGRGSGGATALSAADLSATPASGLPNAKTVCKSICPGVDILDGTQFGTPPNVWQLSHHVEGDPTAGDCLTNVNCRVQARLKVMAAPEGTLKVINGCNPFTAFDPGSLCWGWHGANIDDSAPLSDNILWNATASSGGFCDSTSVAFIENQGITDLSEFSIGECTPCGGAKSVQYMADSPNPLPDRATLFTDVELGMGAGIPFLVNCSMDMTGACSMQMIGEQLDLRCAGVPCTPASTPCPGPTGARGPCKSGVVKGLPKACL